MADETPEPRKPRQRKTARQRADERLGVEQRKVDDLLRRWQNAHDEAERLAAELEEAERRLQYAKDDPALADDPIPGTEAAPAPEPPKVPRQRRKS